MGFFRDLFFGKPKQTERPLPGVKQPPRTKTPQRRPAAIATPYAREALNKEPPMPKTSKNVKNERWHRQSSSMRSNSSRNKSRNDDNDFLAMSAAMVMLDSNDTHQVKHKSDSLDRYSTIVSESRSDSGSSYGGGYGGGSSSGDTSSSSDCGGGGGCD